MKLDLKPCPFCGGKARLWEDTTSMWLVQCDLCGCRTLLGREAKQAILVWNRRISDGIKG